MAQSMRQFGMNPFEVGHRHNRPPFRAGAEQFELCYLNQYIYQEEITDQMN